MIGFDYIKKIDIKLFYGGVVKIKKIIYKVRFWEIILGGVCF